MLCRCSTNQTLSDIIHDMYEFAVSSAVTSIRRRGVEIADVRRKAWALSWNWSRATELSRLMAAPFATISIFAFKPRVKPSW